MTLRKTTSLTTLLSFILLLITSIVLYVTPQGKIAYWANWQLLGLDKEQWGALHTNLGLLFVIAGIVHTALNWKAITAYLKNKMQKLRLFTPDFNVALIITLAVTLFTLFELPPLNAIQHQNEALKAAAEEKYGSPPYGHAEASSLQSFCSRTGLDLNQALQKLEAAGLQKVSASATLADISEANNMTPQALYNLIKTTPGQPSDRAPATGTGLGKKTIQSICTENGLNSEAVIKALRELGVEASANQPLRDLAATAGKNPSELFEIILSTHE